MPTLRELREQLRPVYHHYTDAVISMIGLKPHPEVLNSAKTGDLAEAHTMQVLLERAKVKATGSFNPNFDNVPPAPVWLKKPIKPISAKKPSVELVGLPSQTMPTEIAHIKIGEKVVGLAVLRIAHGRQGKALAVDMLQQWTERISSKEARKLKGWEHSAMQEIEKIAKRGGYRLLLFSSGEMHSQNNIKDKLSHGEILEYYGRLPIQHGYRLTSTSGKGVFGHSLYAPEMKLWWVKRVK